MPKCLVEWASELVKRQGVKQLSINVTYTNDGRAVLRGEDDQYLVSVFDTLEFSEQDSSTILKDLHFYYSWMYEAHVRVPEPILIRTAQKDSTGGNIKIIPAGADTLEAFIEKIEGFGAFTVFAGAPGVKMIGWEDAVPTEVQESMQNFFRVQRQKAIKACLEVDDPLKLFSTAS